MEGAMNRTRVELKLSDFGISELTGFVPPSPPLRCLPSAFSTWEALAGDLSTALKERTIRDKVRALPAVEWSETTLRSEAEWWRAYVVLTFISQAYLWAEGEAGLPHTLPGQLARPWCTVADHLGVPPVITYASTVLYNWGLRDPSRPIDGDNLFALTNFTGTEDESWFYMVAILVEKAAVPGLKAVAQAYSAMQGLENEELAHSLREVEQSLKQMLQALQRMYERCDPQTFYVRIRPFQAGSKGLDVLPKGIVYEGVDSSPRQYSGASAAQNSVIPSFDIFLGAQHTGSDAEFLQSMRGHMPPQHRAFLEVLSQQPSVREYVKESGDYRLVRSYNGAVQAFAEFRSQHVILVARYILMQQQHTVNASLKAKGTGGTDFMLFLKKVRDDTLALKIET